MKYYVIKVDSDNTPYVDIISLDSLDKDTLHSKWYIKDLETDKIYQNDFFVMEYIDEETMKMGTDELKINRVSIMNSERMASEYENASSNAKDIVSKDTKKNILPVDSVNYLPFTRAVVKAIFKYGNDSVGVGRDIHSQKRTLINNLNKAGLESREITPAKADAILKLYNIELSSIFKDEFK